MATSFSGQFSGGLFCTSKDFVQGGAPRLSSWGVTGPLQSPYLDILDFQDSGRQDICNIDKQNSLSSNFKDFGFLYRDICR